MLNSVYMIRQAVVLATIVLAAYLGKRFFFPDDVALIQRRLERLSVLLTKPKGENIIQTANKITQAVDFFYAPVSVTVDRNKDSERIVTEQDKNRLKESITSIKFRYEWVNVSFQEIHTVVSNSEATTETTARLEFHSQEQGPVYDLYKIALAWRKLDREWYITHVDVSLEEQP